MDIKSFFGRYSAIFKNDPRIETYRRDAVMAGDPDAVLSPRDWQEAADIVKWCSENDLPLTVCGARTSMTGSSVAEDGILLTTDHFNKVIDIGVKENRPYAVVEPGLIARDFQRKAEENGFHYPVVPTSCDNAFLGGMVSTNATGEDFYKYGPTRGWVREISFIKADGTTGILKRKTDTSSPPLSPMDRGLYEKGRGGYFLDGEEIDKIIGSEGTLVVITRVIFDLLPAIPKTFVILAPFTSRPDALKFIDDANKSAWGPRAIEYMDTFAMSLMKICDKCPKFSEDVKALVYIKDEAPGDDDICGVMEKWAERLEKALSKTPGLMSEIAVAVTEKEKEELHKLRRRIPEAISEIGERTEKDGGGKVSGDWWVPKKHMLTAMEKVYEEALPLNIDFTMYGHLGDGHPHTTFLCKNAGEKKKAKEMVMLHSRRAALLGGGVAGEHGIGKIKRDLLPIQYRPETIAKMRRLKEDYDPKWILGRGNILLNII